MKQPNLSLIYPSFDHLSIRIKKAATLDELNLIVHQLNRRDSWAVHDLDWDTLCDAWNLIERQARAINPDAYALGNGEFRLPSTMRVKS